MGPPPTSPWRTAGLDGQRVMLAGEMWSPQTADGRVDRFQLVYSNSRCCFSGPPKVQHFVKATVPPGKDVDVSNGIVNVIGTLHVGVERRTARSPASTGSTVEKVEP